MKYFVAETKRHKQESFVKHQSVREIVFENTLKPLKVIGFERENFDVVVCLYVFLEGIWSINPKIVFK